jgi:prepilin-type N-terminal cleavage/methylation domain-containing protein
MTGRHASDAKLPSESGFTLIEMLVALALMALISSVLAASVRTARLTLAYVERSSTVAPVQGVQTFLRSALSQARPAQRDGTGGSDLSFAGAPAAMTFTTAHSPGGQFAGLYRIGIDLVAAVGGRPGFDLMLTQTMARPQPPEGQPPARAEVRRTRLLDKVQDVEFNYFGALPDDGTTKWRTNWVQLDKLPKLVAIDVKFVAGDPRGWHRMIVPLFVSDTSNAPCPPRRSC